MSSKKKTLNWEKANVNFKDSSKQLMTAKVHSKVKLNDLQKEYQALSNQLKKDSKHNLRIACARHYAGINKWVAGSFTDVGDDVVLYDVSYNQAFDEDEIDGVEYYVVANGKEGYFDHPKIHPKKNDLARPNKLTIDKSVFGVK
jgi:hypothetical protein